ncbi:tumor necrosis factor receptor superfamily member 25 [Dicentrarchus labrax]|uniref:tumor necrosis factor receptor superfamily member 25 n=1 Tax=Dicentrarchus labrax TaxID=13489 RepID=UPI0021F4FDED|nr:tumor necrosis factor receptor superfamily member 25 [Dicentrarchus labrax]
MSETNTHSSWLLNILRIDSSNMDFILGFSLILAFLPPGQTEQTTNLCHEKCPAGYYRVDSCGNSQLYKCEICRNGTYTDIENTHPRCNRCATCYSQHHVVIRNCSISSNVVCDCKDGYYNANPGADDLDCKKCLCEQCEGLNNSDYQKKCGPCQRAKCLKDPECKRNCLNLSTTPTTTPTTPPSTPPSTPPTTPPSATPSTTPSATPSTTPSTTPSATSSATPSTTQSTPPSSPSQSLPWLFLMGVLVTFMLLFWLLLLFTRNSLRYPHYCSCWSVNKDLQPPPEDPKFNEHCSHQDGSPTTLTFTISEETPMMSLNLSPATPEHPAHVSPLLPDAKHKADRQDEQSGLWPAIVLYTIIKEVPLRRWKEFLRLLSVADQQLERVELEAGLGLGSIEKQYQMLRLWSQQSSASLNDVFSALHYMDLSGCAQLLQESLEKLQWRPELKQGFTDHGLNGAMQDI